MRHATKRQWLLEGGGITAIYAPEGQCMTEPLPEGTEGIVCAELDLGIISLAKAAADPAGHCARADVRQSPFDKTPRERIVTQQRQAVEQARPAEAVAAVAATPATPAQRSAESPEAGALRRAA